MIASRSWNAVSSSYTCREKRRQRGHCKYMVGDGEHGAGPWDLNGLREKKHENQEAWWSARHIYCQSGP